MIAQPTSPPIPRPPHDPRFWLLDGAVGWRALASETKNIALRHTLTLARNLTTGRQFNEAGGTFGGLIPPGNVAIGSDGSVYLLDLKTCRLKRFDPCECMFDIIPCIGERNDDPRRPKEPTAVGISNANLLICDPGTSRLLVFALPGFVWHGEWRPVRLENKVSWEPFGIATDPRQRVYVTDRTGGAIHIFSTRGFPIGCITGLAQPTYIAVGNDRMLVMTDDGVKAFKLDGTRLKPPVHPSEAHSWFSNVPIGTDSSGNLDFRALCRSVGAKDGFFDESGDPVDPSKWVEDQPLEFLKEGEYVSTPIDSSIHACVWHRLILGGAIPPNTRIIASAYTSEEKPTDADIKMCTSWVELPAAITMRGGEWDALSRTPPGRYLTLRLKLTGAGEATPCLDSIRIEYPRISLRRYLPAVFSEDPIGAEFLDRFLAVFDTTLRSIERQVDLQAQWFDPRSSPARPVGAARTDFLSWLASWIGLDVDRRIPEKQLRHMLQKAAQVYRCRGTPGGLRQWLLVTLALDCPPPSPAVRSCTPPAKPMCGALAFARRPWQPPPLVLEHFQLRRWLFLGAGRLGAQAELWGQSIVNRSQLDENARVGATRINTVPDPRRDPFLVYANRFTVFLPACYARDPSRRKALERLIASEQPAHTRATVEFVQPRFRIGVQSCIGFDSVVGRYPGDVILRSTRLDADALLAGAPTHKQHLTVVGVDSRIGTTTLLN